MASITVPDFDSSAIDDLTRDLSRLEGLASCCASLSHADAEGALTMILIDKALPELALTMLQLAQDGQKSADRLWEQCGELRRALEANHG